MAQRARGAEEQEWHKVPFDSTEKQNTGRFNWPETKTEI